MRWCEAHQNDYPDNEFTVVDGNLVHTRGSNHAADNAYRGRVDYPSKIEPEVDYPGTHPGAEDEDR